MVRGPDEVEEIVDGVRLVARSNPGQVTINGKSRLVNVSWEVGVDGNSWSEGFAGQPDETTEWVRAQLREWGAAHRHLLQQSE